MRLPLVLFLFLLCSGFCGFSAKTARGADDSSSPPIDRIREWRNAAIADVYCFDRLRAIVIGSNNTILANPAAATLLTCDLDKSNKQNDEDLRHLTPYSQLAESLADTKVEPATDQVQAIDRWSTITANSAARYLTFFQDSKVPMSEQAAFVLQYFETNRQCLHSLVDTQPRDFQPRHLLKHLDDLDHELETRMNRFLGSLQINEETKQKMYVAQQFAKVTQLVAEVHFGMKRADDQNRSQLMQMLGIILSEKSLPDASRSDLASMVFRYTCLCKLDGASTLTPDPLDTRCIDMLRKRPESFTLIFGAESMRAAVFCELPRQRELRDYFLTRRMPIQFVQRRPAG